MAERDTRTPGPLVLDANAADNWRKFFMQFEIYLVAKGKDEKPDKLKVRPVGRGDAMGAPAPPRRLLRSTFLLKK